MPIQGTTLGDEGNGNALTCRSAGERPTMPRIALVYRPMTASRSDPLMAQMAG